MKRRTFVSALSAMPLISSRLSIAGPEQMTMDTHAHAFTRNLPQAADARYVVDYDASIDDYIKMLDAQSMTHGVLIQPSFLGTDNSYLLGALGLHPDRLRGVAVVPSSVTRQTLEDMKRQGVVGIRWNLIGKPDPDFNDRAMQLHLKLIADLRLKLEIQAEARRMPQLIPPVLHHGINVIVDHLGRPSQDDGVTDAGFRYLLNSARSRRVWVKLSGWYRLGPGKVGEELAADAARLLCEAFGPQRLLYGSDWPHTQFEKLATPDLARRHFETWAPSAADRRTILGSTAFDLFIGHDDAPRLRKASRALP